VTPEYSLRTFPGGDFVVSIALADVWSVTAEYLEHVLHKEHFHAFGALGCEAAVILLSARKVAMRASRVRSKLMESPCERSQGAILR
jgi:hypothetical protein